MSTSHERSVRNEGRTALDQAQTVADAVLSDGYLTGSSASPVGCNRIRWQFGILMPPALADTDEGEYATSRTECLAEPAPDALLHLRLRFLQVRTRTVLRIRDEHCAPVDSMMVDGTELTSSEELVKRQIDAVFPVSGVLAGTRTVPFTVDGREGGELVRDRAGGTVARLVRRRWPLHGELVLDALPLPGLSDGVRLRVEVRNTTDWHTDRPRRAHALRHALIGVHTLLALTGGTFLSVLDPPQWAVPAVRDCANERTWPVLVGEPGEQHLMLSAPVILDDYPTVDDYPTARPRSTSVCGGVGSRELGDEIAARPARAGAHAM